MKATLTYHSIDDSGSPISVPESVFRTHAEWLARSGPPVVSIDRLLALPASESALAITFDDGFRNFATTAWPVLRDLGLPVTLYIPTAHVGRSNDWGGWDGHSIPELPLLDWEALARLAADGVTMGSHTCTHVQLPRLADAQVADELERSARTITERIGTRPTSLAYPYGAHDARTVRAAERVYEHAVTTELRVLSPGDSRCRLPRVDMFYMRTKGRMESWGSIRMRMYLRARAGARKCRQLVAGTA
jgi:peptidoglycan/xylan/chitin deacetylase (PgdA/CDA1 family)